mmetsp:Transcript_39383/g.63489  ORF Transcript_39383/g.63489 Transcript_39383/m.63489 type:complete len:93 (+) Transcript_39383:1513-1791(+)
MSGVRPTSLRLLSQLLSSDTPEMSADLILCACPGSCALGAAERRLKSVTESLNGLSWDGSKGVSMRRVDQEKGKCHNWTFVPHRLPPTGNEL